MSTSICQYERDSNEKLTIVSNFRYVTQALPSLNELDLSSCARVTDAGVAQLASAKCLERLSLAGCRLLTETALEHLGTVQNLVRYNFVFMFGTIFAIRIHLRF